MWIQVIGPPECGSPDLLFPYDWGLEQHLMSQDCQTPGSSVPDIDSWLSSVTEYAEMGKMEAV